MRNDNDPTLIGYYDVEGNEIKLNELIKIELSLLCNEYIENTGKKPGRILIRSWVTRLNLAYHDLILTEKK